jgi:hypothetical protein
MPATFVDGESRRWKARVTKRIHGYAHRLIVTVFGLEDGGNHGRLTPRFRGTPASWSAPSNRLLGESISHWSMH